MDRHNPEAWFAQLLQVLSEEKQASKLSDDNPRWEYIDGEIVKLGSLNHAQLDIAELQRQGLTLLASESKDFRLVSHLLRTLQHEGNLLLAIRILTQYVAHYWTIAWPQAMANKQRFADQVLKRFEPGIISFAAASTLEQRDLMLDELTVLAQYWRTHDMPALASATDGLFTLFQRAFGDYPLSEPSPGQSKKDVVIPPVVVAAGTKAGVIGTPGMNIDASDDKSWRDTLLRVASLLCEQQPASPQGYRLRRHALWHSITIAPPAENDGRTPLAAVSADRVADYQTRLSHVDMTLWQQVEQSLLLAPYWLDGHHLSAVIARQLGHDEVAQAIRDEVRRFVARLPQLTMFSFNDRSPFISNDTARWLADEPQKAVVSLDSSNEMIQQVWQCNKEHGLEAALVLLEQQPAEMPRAHFYRQYLMAQLLEASGLKQLAHHHYQTLYETGMRMSLLDWEPVLLQQLKEKLTVEL
ncbi:type VI secretion system protein TssA [Phytobacter sp. AG2a]